MATCLVPDCENDADHNLGIRLRRPNTSAIWAPNCNAYLCDDHAEEGCTIMISIIPNSSGKIKTIVSAGGNAKTRTTDITHAANE